MAAHPAEEGKARIKLQRQLIAELRAYSGSTDLGAELLATLEAMQKVSEDDRTWLEPHVVSGPPPKWRTP